MNSGFYYFACSMYDCDLLSKILDSGKFNVERHLSLYRPVNNPGRPFLGSFRSRETWVGRMMGYVPKSLAQIISIGRILVPIPSRQRKNNINNVSHHCPELCSASQQPCLGFVTLRGCGVAVLAVLPRCMHPSFSKITAR